MLVDRGLISSEQLASGLAAQREFGGRLGMNLVALGFATEEQIAVSLSDQLGVPLVDPRAIESIPPDVIARVPREVATKHRVVPLKVGRDLHVCLPDPQNEDRLDQLRSALGTTLRVFVATELTINRALDRYYDELVSGPARLVSTAEVPVVTVEVLPYDETGGQPASNLETAGSILDQLADVMVEQDVLAVLRRYFVERFGHLVVLAIREETVVPILNAGAFGTGHLSAAPVSLKPGTPLHSVAVKPHLLYQPKVKDPDILGLCKALSMRDAHLTIASVASGARMVYVLLAQGLDGDRLKAILPDIKALVPKVSDALRIVEIRKRIRLP